MSKNQRHSSGREGAIVKPRKEIGRWSRQGRMQVWAFLSHFAWMDGITCPLSHIMEENGYIYAGSEGG